MKNNFVYLYTFFEAFDSPFLLSNHDELLRYNLKLNFLSITAKKAIYLSETSARK